MPWFVLRTVLHQIRAAAAAAPQLTRLALENLNKSVPDAELRAKLTPNYSIGCKRVLGSDSYYQALQQDNVELISSAVKEVRGERRGVDHCEVLQSSSFGVNCACMRKHMYSCK